jgi:hypothetical protein
LNKRYLIKRRKRPWTTLGGLLPPSLNILGALDLLLRLRLGLLLPPSSIDIASQCGVVLLHLLKFFLDRSYFFVTFESENERIHLVIILNN